MSVRTFAAVAARTALLAAVIIFAAASAALASAARTFVASTGSDSNTSSNCPAADPCRSFAAALTATASGGEIVALDTAGYGEVTITGPVSIIAAVSAEVSVAAGTTGITITAGASDTIILKNLTINGSGLANTTGITVNSGRVVVENSSLKLLQTGLIDNNSKVDLVNCDVIGNNVGVQTTGQGSDFGGIVPTFGPTQVRISYGTVLDNATAYFMTDPGLDASSNTANRITVLLYNPGFPVAAGNATVVNGSGTSCTQATNTQCKQINSFNTTQNNSEAP